VHGATIIGGILSRNRSGPSDPKYRPTVVWRYSVLSL